MELTTYTAVMTNLLLRILGIQSPCVAWHKAYGLQRGFVQLNSVRCMLHAGAICTELECWHRYPPRN